MLTQRTAMDLQLLPFGTWDTKQADADVPSKVATAAAQPQAGPRRPPALVSVSSWIAARQHQLASAH
jgi:hypothetical protein